MNSINATTRTALAFGLAWLALMNNRVVAFARDAATSYEAELKAATEAQRKDPAWHPACREMA